MGGGTYHGTVSESSPTPPEPNWQQPPFAPGPEDPAPTVSGAIVVPGGDPAPPSVLESVIRVIAGVVWPVMLVLGIFGPVPFFAAMVIALVASSVLTTVSKELKQRRRARAVLPPKGEDLR